MRRGGAGRQVLAWALRVVVVAAALGVFFLDPLTPSGERDTASITTYDSFMTLERDGTLRTEDNVTVQMPGGKRGIFRIFDTASPRRDNVEHPVTVEAVERDGMTEPYTRVDSASGTDTIRIGSENVYLDPGPHTYRIASTTTDVFEPGDDGETLWWWDVVGAGWQMPIGDVDVAVQLPAEPLRAECVQDEDTPCSASIEGTNLRVRTGPLEPFTPVTVRVAFDEADVGTPIPGSSDALTVVASVLAGLLAAALGLGLFRATREQAPGFPVLFEPPLQLPPALGVKVLDEVDSGADLQATLFDLAERGVVQLQGDDDRWVIRCLIDTSTKELHPIETSLLARLGLSSAGDSFTVSKSKTAGETISRARGALRAQVAASSAEYLHPAAAGWLAIALGWLSLLAVGGMVGIYFVGDGGGWVAWPLLIGAASFALVAMGMMFDRGVTTTRTPVGRELWSRTGGFARFLATDSSESRFDAAAHLDWYPRYLPWAVALGVGDEWAKRYEAQGVSTPAVPWLLWTGTGPAHLSASRMNHSFDAAITSASAAYAASQASSGGGGGFSGGSGGGGGGGGSW